MFVISLQNVTLTYRTGHRLIPALRDVSLEVHAGEVFGIIGYSGAGKSTLLRCINLLERPQSGQVWVDGVDLLSLRKRELQKQRKKIGMIFQHFHLLNSATVRDNILFPLRLAKTPVAEAERRVAELLELVGLTGYERHYPSQLSGGQKQRVAIARALANFPKVLLCDEATSALDPETTQSILDLLREIHRQFGVTVVMVTHEISVVQRVCHRVAVMDQGRMVEVGRVVDVFLRPQAEVTRRLLGWTNAEGVGADLPEQVFREGTLVCELAMAGEAAQSPLLFQAAREAGVTCSILRGTVDAIQDTPFARMVVAWYGDAKQVQAAVRRLEAHGAAVRWLNKAERMLAADEAGMK
nr:ATP-binding cassette domain-containing protein [Alicyclobacillus cellulosilyticus]